MPRAAMFLLAALASSLAPAIADGPSPSFKKTAHFQVTAVVRPSCALSQNRVTEFRNLPAMQTDPNYRDHALFVQCAGTHPTLELSDGTGGATSKLFALSDGAGHTIPFHVCFNVYGCPQSQWMGNGNGVVRLPPTGLRGLILTIQPPAPSAPWTPATYSDLITESLTF